MRYGDIPKDAKTILPKEAALEVRFCCTKKNIWATAYVYMARKDDDITKVAVAGLKSGLQRTNRDGDGCYYVDDIRTYGDRWVRPAKAINPDMNGMSRLVLDTCGYNKFFVRIQYPDDCIWYVDTAGFR